MNVSAIFVVQVLLGQVAQVPWLESTDFPKDRQVKVLAATVRIRNATTNRDGTGALVGKSGGFAYVLTAQHLIQGAERLEVSTFGKESYPRPTQTYADVKVTAETAELVDLALLRFRAGDELISFLRICPEKQIPGKPLLPMLTAGCEDGKVPTLLLEKTAERKHARKPESKEMSRFWVIDRKYHQGRSGGPLVDKHGYLLGICSGTNRDMTYFVDIEVIHRFLIQNGYRWLLVENETK